MYDGLLLHNCGVCVYSVLLSAFLGCAESAVLILNEPLKIAQRHTSVDTSQ